MDATHRTIDYSKCKPNILDRFWAKVDRSGDCWEWTGAKPGGYGDFYVYPGLHMIASRFIDIAFNGDFRDDDGGNTLHKCDNPACVRPSHLFRGSKKDNTQDMITKGRAVLVVAPKGEDHPAHVLTEGQVREIYRRRNAGEGVIPLGREFGVSHNMVSRIAMGKAWKHLKLGE